MLASNRTADSARTKRLAVAGATGLIGSQVVAHAVALGHEVVSLSRSMGVDLTDRDSLGDRLEGVDVVIDVTRPSSMALEEAISFFTTVAENLGRASAAAGVGRMIVLSIIGLEKNQDFDWYVATLAHERAAREHFANTQVLRSTQFHEFPEQVLGRGLRGDKAEVMDVQTQPVASREVARLLVELAIGDQTEDVEIAGPQPEQLVNLVSELTRLRGDKIEVVPVPVSVAMASGSLLPGAEALLRGETWLAWARRHYGREH